MKKQSTKGHVCKTGKKNTPWVTAIIPARGGSKSIPQKNLVGFCGKPLITWSIEQALRSQHINEVYVTTDDKAIGKVSKQYGAKIIWRPKELATDTSSSEEALLHAMSEIEKKQGIDIVVFLQATSPLREGDDIDKAIRKFISEGADSLFSAAILEDFCVWQDQNGGLESLTYDYKNRGRRQERNPYYLENGSIYIFKPQIIKERNNRLGGKIVFCSMPVWQSYEIDTYKDIEICEVFMRNRILKKEAFAAGQKNIQLIVYDFDGVLTDNRVILREDGMESVVVNRSDGLAIAIIKNLGIPQIILTTETNKVVEARTKKLGIPVFRNTKNKKEFLINYCKTKKTSVRNVVYIGNDINDLEVMKIVGYPVCPSDAQEEIKAVAKLMLDATGGAGVVRELIRCIKIK